MAVNIDQLKRWLRELELGFWVSERAGALCVPYLDAEMNTRLDVEISLDPAGSFIYFNATVLFNIDVVRALRSNELLRVVNRINRTERFVKICIDSGYRSIRACGEAWIADGTLGAGQFRAMLQSVSFCAFSARKQVIAALAGDAGASSEVDILIEEMSSSS